MLKKSARSNDIVGDISATGFVVPTLLAPRDRYATIVETLPSSPGVHACLHVTVVETKTPTGDPSGRTVGTYVRTLSSMYDTFEPFRQLRDGDWYDYALVAADYTHLSVLDLATGDIVATEQPTEEAVQAARDVLTRRTGQPPTDTEAHDFAHSWGFCPTTFHVPDFWDLHGGTYGPDSDRWGPGTERVNGSFGLYAGCHWGDDSSYKIRYVDLSRIGEGIVSTDDRFGYLELPYQLDLAQAVHYDRDADTFDIPTTLTFSRSTGHAERLEHINWAPAATPVPQ